ncbi:NADH-quinone oxidoreductase subunit NuoE [Enterobacteriaceae endosymbiont of Neohaemonia nigricornis]|uniref:NADH-quinone oxidoreductase subunit NuoE n=1 Tax=Enterobacteriaceae endosymbiont of Neohaemonia nigricornis TaxID=2675792 RepID=UPI001449BE55|nr:NADH-quinone oxidoreductase subunit NuoE [Enterobacteriaceae endosymbiont of Neohaemonia nigricornis]QJC30551.1 NADH-quinone oxidoreductase subunit NuoE [Enterobacteriaceae endosymbiont of Neohaemonia nigricornis]
MNINKNNKKIILNNQDMSIINKIITHYECNRASIIELLIFFQKKYGWISDEIINIISKILKINVCEIDSIATFYSQIFRLPVGKYVIKYCDSVVCYITGYLKIIEYIKQKLQIDVGQTTKDNLFTLLPICCLGHCDNSPVIMINENIYTAISIDNINNILDNYINEE